MSTDDPLIALRRVLEVSRFDKSVGDGALSEMLNDAIDPVIRADERIGMGPLWRGGVAEVEAETRKQCAAEVRECQADAVPNSDAWHRLGEAADFILRGGTP